MTLIVTDLTYYIIYAAFSQSCKKFFVVIPLKIHKRVVAIMLILKYLLKNNPFNYKPTLNKIMTIYFDLRLSILFKIKRLEKYQIFILARRTIKPNIIVVRRHNMLLKCNY